MITIKEEIAVPAPPDRVWGIVSDPAEVVGCISGAELGKSHEDDSFDGTLIVKFGAMRVKFRARVSLVTDMHSREGRLSAKGNDRQGATRFKADATFGVAEDVDSGGSAVSVLGEITLAGKLASLIEAGAAAVVSRMTKEFSAALVRRCAGEQAAEAMPVRHSWWARLGVWWRRIVQKRQRKQRGVPNGKAE